jgi:hypothetical protein
MTRRRTLEPAGYRYGSGSNCVSLRSECHVNSTEEAQLHARRCYRGFFAAIHDRMSAATDEIMKRQMSLLSELHDLSDRPAQGVVMVHKMTVQEGVLAGLMIGALAAVGATRWIRSLLYETTATDPTAISFSVGLLLLAASLGAHTCISCIQCGSEASFAPRISCRFLPRCRPTRSKAGTLTYGTAAHTGALRDGTMSWQSQT